MITLFVLMLLALIKDRKIVKEDFWSVWAYLHNVREVLSIIFWIVLVLFIIYLISECGTME